MFLLETDDLRILPCNLSVGTVSLPASQEVEIEVIVVELELLDIYPIRTMIKLRIHGCQTVCVQGFHTNSCGHGTRRHFETTEEDIVHWDSEVGRICVISPKAIYVSIYRKALVFLRNLKYSSSKMVI